MGSKKKSDSEVGSSSLADQMKNCLSFEEDKKDDDPPMTELSSSTTRSTLGISASVSGRNVSSSSSLRVIISPEELNTQFLRAKDNFNKDNFSEALSFYDEAIAISPGDARLHCNRAAVLITLKRFGEAVRECEEAIRLSPLYVRAHQLLGSLLLCLGQVENAREHLFSLDHEPDQATLQRLQAVEKHITRCSDARILGHWTTMLKEAEAAITSGAKASAQLFACQAEAHLKLHQLNDAGFCLYKARICELSTAPCQSKHFGMLSEAYILFVQAQIDITLGRFDEASTAIESAAQIDLQSAEVTALLEKMMLVGQARTHGTQLFISQRYEEACTAYGEGLSLDSSNLILYCNRAACWYKLGKWEKSLADSNHALLIQPHYNKALLQRATSNAKLERWADAVRDYEILRQKLPNIKEVAEYLSHAQVELKKSCREVGGTVELVSDLEKFRAAITSSGASVVHFKEESNLQCKRMSSVVDTLSTKYRSISFLKVDMELSPAIAAAENITTVPTFLIYKNGSRMMEMVSPSPELLEFWVRNNHV